MNESEARLIAETFSNHHREQEAAKICSQCHTAHNLIPDPPIFDANDKRVYFCQHCWDEFCADSTIIGEA